MPILNVTERKSARGRAVVTAIYALLILGGATMVYPFMIMVTGSVSNDYDYNRRSALPRFAWSRSDRFMRALASQFPPTHRQSIEQLRSYFPDFPAEWQTWPQMGDERETTRKWADKQLAPMRDPKRRKQIETAARDYADFMSRWNVRECVLAYDKQYMIPFLRRRYGTLDAYNRAWE